MRKAQKQNPYKVCLFILAFLFIDTVLPHDLFVGVDKCFGISGKFFSLTSACLPLSHSHFIHGANEVFIYLSVLICFLSSFSPLSRSSTTQVACVFHRDAYSSVHIMWYDEIPSVYSFRLNHFTFNRSDRFRWLPGWRVHRQTFLECGNVSYEFD